MPAAGQSFYEEEDAQQILRMAVRETTPEGSISWESLLASAAELGISPEDLAKAEARYTQEKAERTEREVFLEAEQFNNYLSDAAMWGVVSGFLIAINLAQMEGGGGQFWALYPMVGWGIALGLRWLVTFRRDREWYRKAFETWREDRPGAAPRKPGGRPDEGRNA